MSIKNKISGSVSCSECGFAEVCQAYLFERQEPIFIRDLSRERRVSKNAYIYQSGNPVDALYALKSGVAKIYDAQHILQGILLPGQVFGAEELFTSHHFYSVQAATDVQICELKKTHFYELGQLTTHFTHFIIRLISRSAREKQLFINVLVKSDGLQKVNNFIQLLADIRKEYGFEHRAIELPLNKKELAQLLGISLSTLTRALTTLTEQKRVEVNKKKITLLHH